MDKINQVEQRSSGTYYNIKCQTAIFHQEKAEKCPNCGVLASLVQQLQQENIKLQSKLEKIEKKINAQSQRQGFSSLPYIFDAGTSEGFHDEDPYEDVRNTSISRSSQPMTNHFSADTSTRNPASYVYNQDRGPDFQHTSNSDYDQTFLKVPISEASEKSQGTTDNNSTGSVDYQGYSCTQKEPGYLEPNHIPYLDEAAEFGNLPTKLSSRGENRVSKSSMHKTNQLLFSRSHRSNYSHNQSRVFQNNTELISTKNNISDNNKGSTERLASKPRYPMVTPPFSSISVPQDPHGKIPLNIDNDYPYSRIEKTSNDLGDKNLFQPIDRNHFPAQNIYTGNKENPRKVMNFAARREYQV